MSKQLEIASPRAADGRQIDRLIFGNELKYVKEVLDTQFRSSKGAGMMGRLEKAFAEKFGAAYAISHVNGTATLHSIMEAIELRPGDEVIVPPLTMSATSFAVLQANATPVFADVDPETFLISPAAIEKQITKRTKAIAVVSLYGLAPEMDEIMAIARRHSLFVIEDNAQAYLTYYKGRVAGTLGHAASFSLQSSKHITSGEGGMVLTQDPRIADRVRKINSLGYAGVSANKAKITKKDIQDPDYLRHVTLGWNYRMPELCAAVALGQLENIDAIVERRRESARMLDEAVRGCDWLAPQKVRPHHRSSYWTYVVRLAHPRLTWHQFRDKFMELGGDGIYACWQLTYLEPFFTKRELLGRDGFISKENLKRYKMGLCPVAESLQPRLLQFKTNYWDLKAAVRQSEILAKTIRVLGK